METTTARRKRASKTSHNGTEFSFSSGALYADLDEYVAKGFTFTIDRIDYQPKAGYEGADRWAITVSPYDGRSSEIITLQSNEGRDAELRLAAAHLEKHGPIPNAKLVRSGKAFYLRNAVNTERP